MTISAFDSNHLDNGGWYEVNVKIIRPCVTSASKSSYTIDDFSGIDFGIDGCRPGDDGLGWVDPADPRADADPSRCHQN